MNVMRAKGLPVLTLVFVVTAATGCDHVGFDGFHVELQAPATAPEPASPVDPADPEIEPLDLGPVVYLVERLNGAAARAVPVAELREGEYRPLPPEGEEPDLVERFAASRWTVGAELVLLGPGGRAGTFVAEGGLEEDRSTCRLRPSGAGHVEVHPAGADEPFFAAVERRELDEPLVAAAFPAEGDVQAASVDVTQRLIPELGVPWPPSVPGMQRDLRPVAGEGENGPGFASSFVHDDDLVVGPSTPEAYGLFVMAEPVNGGYEPTLTWYDRADQGGKAFPRFLGLHGLRDDGGDLIFEVFGEDERWIAVLGREAGTWTPLFVDECGTPPDPEALRTFP